MAMPPPNERRGVKVEEVYSEGALDAIRSSGNEASNRNHTFVNDLHLLLVLAKEEVVRDALVDAGVDVDELSSSVDLQLPKGDKPVQVPKLTMCYKRVIELSVDEVNRRRTKPVNTIHLLRAIVREKEGPAAKTLLSFGLNEHNLDEKIPPPRV